MRRRSHLPEWEDFEEEYDSDEEYDPYDHLMDDVDALLQADAYTGPGQQPEPDWQPDPEVYPYGRQTPPEPQYQQPRQSYAYNPDFQTREQRRSARPKSPGDRAFAYAEQPKKTKGKKAKPHREKRRHPILKFILCLLVLVIAVSGVLWVLASPPETDQPIGARKDGCATILLAGTDADGTRTDTMMLLYLDQKNGRMSLMSLPRDTYTSANMTVPKLNGIYGVNGGGEAGMEALLGYVTQCVGYRPDGYLLVDLDCFESLVNIMGGVQFDVPMDMYYYDPAQDLEIDLKAGEQRLNGEESMWVVRYRSGYALADLQRVQVQRDFLEAALDQWTSPTKFIRYPAAAVLLASNTTTDLSLTELVWIAKAALAAQGNDMTMETLPGEAAMVGDGSYYIIWPETTANLVNETMNPYEVPVSHETIYSPWY